MKNEHEDEQARAIGGTLLVYGLFCAGLLGVYWWYSRRAEQRMEELNNAAARSIYTLRKPCRCHETAETRPDADGPALAGIDEELAGLADGDG
jgi:hypothetical protein